MNTPYSRRCPFHDSRVDGKEDEEEKGKGTIREERWRVKRPKPGLTSWIDQCRQGLCPALAFCQYPQARFPFWVEGGKQSTGGRTGRKEESGTRQCPLSLPGLVEPRILKMKGDQGPGQGRADSTEEGTVGELRKRALVGYNPRNVTMLHVQWVIIVWKGSPIEESRDGNTTPRDQVQR